MSFKPGDIVQLKSGGPRMTVDRLDHLDKGVHVAWFAGAKLEQGHFGNDSIVLAPAEEPKKK
jgi:uncharacterized protein YodC (DUF2158 family)